MLKFHDEIAQGLSGLWWQTNAALAEAKSHGVPETALHALETVRSESLRLLREAQDAATFRTAESAGRFIVPALEDELESFREATGLQLTLQVCGDAKSHSAESLANLYRAFRSRLDDLACDAVIREGSVVVVFDRDEPQVEFSGKQSLTQG